MIQFVSAKYLSMQLPCIDDAIRVNLFVVPEGLLKITVHCVKINRNRVNNLKKNIISNSTFITTTTTWFYKKIILKTASYTKQNKNKFFNQNTNREH